MNKFLATLSALAATAFAEEAATAAASAVVDLTSENFLPTVTENSDKPVFVKFYAPWCGHCKHLAPMWEEVAKQAEGCTVAKVDCTVQTDVAELMEVQGYPTLKLFADKMMYPYDGARSTDALKAFCEGGYKNAKAQKLPTEQNIFDKAGKLMFDYLDKMQNIWMYEPTVMPLFFLIGAITGFFLAMVLGVGSTVVVEASKDEEEDPIAVEDMDGEGENEGEEKEEKKDK